MKNFLKKNKNNSSDYLVNVPRKVAGGRGLTLVETIVAIAVLSITIMASTSVSATYLRSRTSIKKYQANNEEMSLALNYLAKDIRMSSTLLPVSDGFKTTISLEDNVSGLTVVYAFNSISNALTRAEGAGAAVVIASNITGSFYVRSSSGIPRISIMMKKQGVPDMMAQTTVSMRTKYIDEN